MKKLNLCLFLILLATLLILACDSSGEECNHTEYTVSELQEATSSQDGLAECHCQCGETWTVTVSAHAHVLKNQWISWDDGDPSSKGLAITYCDVEGCPHLVMNEVEQHTHSYDMETGKCTYTGCTRELIIFDYHGPLIRYVIKRGDCLSVLAQRYHTTVKLIMELNPSIKNPDIINQGQEIFIPVN